MHLSPKRMNALKAVLGIGLGLSGILITEDRPTAVLQVIVGMLAGALWAGALAYWWSRSKSTRFYAESEVVCLLFVVVAVLAGFPIAGACAQGGYGLALWIAMQMQESRHKKAISWQDLRASRTD